MKIIKLQINVNKIDKSLLYEGKKGRYLNVTAKISDEPDQYGNDISVWHEQTEQEREAKADRQFLGNGKVLFNSSGPEHTPSPENTAPAQSDEDDDQLPF